MTTITNTYTLKLEVRDKEGTPVKEDGNVKLLIIIGCSGIGLNKEQIRKS